MTSNNKTVMKALDVLQTRLIKLKDIKQDLYDKIMEKWPEDMYGIKGLQIYEKRSEELNAEITLIAHYIHGFYDLMEYVECDVMHLQERKE